MLSSPTTLMWLRPMNDPMIYIVQACTDFDPTAVWDAPEWANAEIGSISHFPWGHGGFAPNAQFKLQYSPSAIHVIYKVDDRFVRSVTTTYGGAVWEDSCVEFFFCPSGEISAGYFNLEVNCGGALLIAHQNGRDVDRVPVVAADARRVTVAHSMPEVVDPEISEPVVWTLEVRLPLDLLVGYASIVTPEPGVVWHSNFYKCAETNSHPHWGSWAPIRTPHPDFHRPEFFGKLSFD